MSLSFLPCCKYFTFVVGQKNKEIVRALEVQLSTTYISLGGGCILRKLCMMGMHTNRREVGQRATSKYAPQRSRKPSSSAVAVRWGGGGETERQAGDGVAIIIAQSALSGSVYSPELGRKIDFVHTLIAQVGHRHS